MQEINTRWLCPDLKDIPGEVLKDTLRLNDTLQEVLKDTLQSYGLFTLDDTENDTETETSNDNYVFHCNMQSTSHCTYIWCRSV